MPHLAVGLSEKRVLQVLSDHPWRGDKAGKSRGLATEDSPTAAGTAAERAKRRRSARARLSSPSRHVAYAAATSVAISQWKRRTGTSQTSTTRGASLIGSAECSSWSAFKSRPNVAPGRACRRRRGLLRDNRFWRKRVPDRVPREAAGHWTFDAKHPTKPMPMRDADPSRIVDRAPDARANWRCGPSALSTKSSATACS